MTDIRRDGDPRSRETSLRRLSLALALLVVVGTVCSLLLALYTASYAVWLTAHPMHSDVAWGRKFIICVMAAATLTILAGAAFATHRMDRANARRWLIGLLVVANVATVVVCSLILCHRL